MTAKLIVPGADVAAPSDTALAARSSRPRDPSASNSTSRRTSYIAPREPGERQSNRSILRGIPPVGGGGRGWRDRAGVTPPQIRERR
jgi:hypothetical protein